MLRPIRTLQQELRDFNREYSRKSVDVGRISFRKMIRAVNEKRNQKGRNKNEFHQITY